jgi:hypothetical protein
MATTTAPNPIIERAIEDCLQCLHWCSACVDAALTSDPSAMAGSIRTCHECAPVCGLTASLLSSNSLFARQLCALCAEICDTCAAECEKHTHVETMRKSAEACRRCAKACREVNQSGSTRKAA